MEQKERIEYMERRLEEAKEALDGMRRACARLEAAREAFLELDAYYGSEAWKEDLAADEAGLLPTELKRGVLSQDGIWNVLEEWREMGSGERREESGE